MKSSAYLFKSRSTSRAKSTFCSLILIRPSSSHACSGPEHARPFDHVPHPKVAAAARQVGRVHRTGHRSLLQAALAHIQHVQGQEP